jgi:hypothetical protein
MSEVLQSKHLEVLEDPLISVFESFAELEEPRKHKAAAIYLYQLLHSSDVSEAFKLKLKSEEGLDPLTYNRHFSGVFFP